MKTYVDIMRALRATNSRLEKEQILFTAYDTCRKFFDWTILAFDYEWIFWINKLPKITNYASFTDEEQIEQLFTDLARRKYTGNAAKNRIVEIVSQYCTKADWEEFFSFILIKDLKAGVNVPTINKALNMAEKKYELPLNSLPYIIKNFSCQLAKDGLDHPELLKGTKIVQQKLDGVRALILVEPKDRLVSTFSRNGKLLINFTHIEKVFYDAMDKGIIKDYLVFDGEIISKNFTTLMTQVTRKKDVNASDAKFCVFDVIPYNEFYLGKSRLNQFNRFAELTTHVANINSPLIYTPETITINLDDPVGKQSLNDYMAKQVQLGYEGVVVKDPDAFYETKRTSAWLKIKPKHTYDLMIVGVEEGKGRLQNTLGNLLCEGYSNDGEFIRVSVGSGFTDIERTEIWNTQDSMLGRMIEVEADGISKDKEGNISLRFPTFLRFRNDRTV